MSASVAVLVSVGGRGHKLTELVVAVSSPAPAWPLLPVVTGQRQFLLRVASSAEQRAEYLPATTARTTHHTQPHFSLNL